VRWLADECVGAGLVRRLRGAGHDVVYVPEFASGMTDAAVLRRACDGDRLLLTEDKDFGELVRLHMPVPGLVLLRVDPERHLLKWVRLEYAVQRFGQRLFGRYVVIEEARFRSRPLLGSTPLIGLAQPGLTSFEPA
jgi:predicted nuclease of predicted toxin-antitoxin system